MNAADYILSSSPLQTNRVEAKIPVDLVRQDADAIPTVVKECLSRLRSMNPGEYVAEVSTSGPDDFADNTMTIVVRCA